MTTTSPVPVVRIENVLPLVGRQLVASFFARFPDYRGNLVRLCDQRQKQIDGCGRRPRTRIYSDARIGACPRCSPMLEATLATRALQQTNARGVLDLWRSVVVALERRSAEKRLAYSGTRTSFWPYEPLVIGS